MKEKRRRRRDVGRSTSANDLGEGRAAGRGREGGGGEGIAGGSSDGGKRG